MNDQHAVVGTLLDYYAAFNTFDVQKILPYFHQPALLMGPQGAFAAATPDLLAPVFATVIDALRARGFGHSELTVRRVESLSASAASVRGIAIRYRVDGQELERVGVTYVLHYADKHWTIAVLITHDPD